MVDVNELSEGLYIEGYIKDQQKDLENKLKNERLISAYKAVMATPAGQAVFWDLLEMCRVFQLSMTGNSWTYFNEGKTSVGLYLMTMLNIGNRFEDVTGFQKLRPEDGNE